LQKYGKFDVSQFCDLEMRMWILVGYDVTTKKELDENYTLDEALTLFSMWQMQQDIKAMQADEVRKKIKKR
jgi:hypothetical protein